MIYVKFFYKYFKEMHLTRRPGKISYRDKRFKPNDFAVLYKIRTLLKAALSLACLKIR